MPYIVVHSLYDCLKSKIFPQQLFEASKMCTNQVSGPPRVKWQNYETKIAFTVKSHTIMLD